MSLDIYLTIIILAITFALLIKSKIPPVAVFVGALTLTITFRLAPLSQSLKGFSNPGMLTVGASCSFISPMGYQTNLMVYGPGGYKFMDFVKIGVPMSVVVGIITLIIAPRVWPF
jgi:hypothetical protein